MIDLKNIKMEFQFELKKPLFWFASIFGILGAILNALQFWQGFLFWCVSNPILFYQAYKDRTYNVAMIFLVYFLITIIGLINWR